MNLRRMFRGASRVAWIVCSSMGVIAVSACASPDPNGAGGSGGVSAQEANDVVSDPVSEEHAALVATPSLNIWGFRSPSASFAPNPNEHGALESMAAPVSAVACTSNTQCPTGYCVDGFCCDSKCDNKCMACSAAKKGSGSDGICGSIKYDTDPDNDCPYGACDGKNMCKNYNGFSCTAAPQCLSNYCVDGFCCNNICMGSCQACSAAKKGSGQDGLCGSIKVATDPDNECSNGDCNGSGACTTSPQPTFPNGTACTASTQCASGYCADGVCCDSWCLGSCQACTAAKKNQGTDGTCGNIANDKDPDEECWGGACNGAGVCKQYNGVPCSDKSQCLSNYCVDGFCCGNICTGWCYACSEARKGGGYDGACGPILSGRDPDNECSPGECNGSGTCNQAQTPLANGTACIASAQCASGNCIDGYCCDTACTETCKACSAAKKGSGANGICGTIASETDPDSECGVGGRCGGNGTCKFYNGAACTSTSQCFSNYCADGVCCGNICNQPCNACTAAKKGQGVDGACGPIANTRDPDNECNPGECNGSGACNQSQTPQANGTACTVATQCSSGNCVDGVCCNTACTGGCQACSATKKGQGTSGTCGPIKYDTDPDEECFGGACDGQGLCKQYNGLTCSGASQCLSGYCTDGYCCNNLCGGMYQACNLPQNLGLCKPSYPTPCSGTQGFPDAPYIPQYPLENGYAPHDIADLNGDGKLDVFATRSSTSTKLNVLLNQGNGTLNMASYSVGSSYARGLPLVDLNGDNRLDYVAYDRYADLVSVLLNQGNGTFLPGVTYATGDEPTFANTADLNGDGRSDIYVWNSVPLTMSVLLNQGNGTFAPKVDYATGNCTAVLPTLDINGDNRLDIACVNSSTSKVGVFVNQGNGTFAPSVEYTTNSSPNSIAVADVNGDGRTDVITGHTSSKLVSVLLNQGNGILAAPVMYTTSVFPYGVEVRDVNADGFLDILPTPLYDRAFSVLLNQGNGTFVESVVNSLTADVQTLVPIDLNGDQQLDFVVGYATKNFVAVVMNQGNGAFAPKVDYTIGAESYTLRVTDVDADNRPDIITASNTYMNVLRNLGNGTFQQTDSYATPDEFEALAIGDITGDNRPEITATSYSNLQIRTNLGNATFSKEGMNNPMQIATTRQPLRVAAGDFNGDGKRDIAMYNRSEGTGAPTVSVTLNQGNGVFGPLTEEPESRWYSYVATATDVNRNGYIEMTEQYVEQYALYADFNGDGRLDKAAYWIRWGQSGQGPSEPIPDYHEMRVYFGDAAGNLSQPTIYSIDSAPAAGSAPTHNGMPPFAAADFNNDGKLDIAYAAYDHARVMFNQGNGVFAFSGPAWSKGSGTFSNYPTGIAAGDINADGKADVFVSWDTLPAYWYLGQGNGTFASTTINVNITGYGIKFTDLTGDGLLDMMQPINSSVLLWPGLGNGAFGASRSYGANATRIWEAFPFDLDNDDRMDILTANDDSRTVTVMYNRCTP